MSESPAPETDKAVNTVRVAVNHALRRRDDSAVLFAGAPPYAVMVMDLTPEGDRVSEPCVVNNPDKLTHVHLKETVA